MLTYLTRVSADRSSSLSVTVLPEDGDKQNMNQEVTRNNYNVNNNVVGVHSCLKPRCNCKRAQMCALQIAKLIAGTRCSLVCQVIHLLVKMYAITVHYPSNSDVIAMNDIRMSALVFSSHGSYRTNIFTSLSINKALVIKILTWTQLVLNKLTRPSLYASVWHMRSMPGSYSLVPRLKTGKVWYFSSRE